MVRDAIYASVCWIGNCQEARHNFVWKHGKRTSLESVSEKVIEAEVLEGEYGLGSSTRERC